MNYNYVSMIEAILFASGKPLEIDTIAKATQLTIEQAAEFIEILQGQLVEADRGIRVVRIDNFYQLVTFEEFEEPIRRALEVDKKTPISKSAMEVLSIIAYNQPCTRLYIEQVRGVESSHLVRTLLEKGLIEEYGRLDMIGKPMGYKTTPLFLSSFKLESLDDLPSIGK